MTWGETEMLLSVVFIEKKSAFKKAPHLAKKIVPMSVYDCPTLVNINQNVLSNLF